MERQPGTSYLRRVPADSLTINRIEWCGRELDASTLDAQPYQPDQWSRRTWSSHVWSSSAWSPDLAEEAAQEEEALWMDYEERWSMEGRISQKKTLCASKRDTSVIGVRANRSIILPACGESIGGMVPLLQRGGVATFLHVLVCQSLGLLETGETSLHRILPAEL